MKQGEREEIEDRITWNVCEKVSMLFGGGLRSP